MNPGTAEIWEEFSQQLKAFIVKRVDDPLDAEDILQETFIKIHSNIGTLRNQERLTPWLYRIARNTLIDHYRSQKIYLDLPESLPDSTKPFDEEPEAHLALGLRDLVNCLPEKYSQALGMAEFEGKTQEEIARLLGLTLSGAKSRVQRGRALLRQELLDCCHFEFDRRMHVLDYTPRQEYCQHCQC